MNISLRTRTEETTAVYFEKTRDPDIQRVLPQRAKTVEEALAIIADVGMCRGQTLAQIADRRPASLRWYMVGCKEASNVLKAGARLVLESLSMPKSA